LSQLGHFFLIWSIINWIISCSFSSGHFLLPHPNGSLCAYWVRAMQTVCHSGFRQWTNSNTPSITSTWNEVLRFQVAQIHPWMGEYGLDCTIWTVLQCEQQQNNSKKESRGCIV
jgi:hypothetical protein